MTFSGVVITCKTCNHLNNDSRNFVGNSNSLCSHTNDDTHDCVEYHDYHDIDEVLFFGIFMTLSLSTFKPRRQISRTTSVHREINDNASRITLYLCQGR